MTIAIDFDGTCVTDAYPNIGEDIGAAPALLELVAQGHRLILLTMRSGDTLRDAENWFRAYGIPLYGVNRNPAQWHFSRSPKVFADLYIDDHALGSPLKTDPALSPKPFLDWVKAREILAAATSRPERKR